MNRRQNTTQQRAKQAHPHDPIAPGQTRPMGCRTYAVRVHIFYRHGLSSGIQMAGPPDLQTIVGAPTSPVMSQCPARPRRNVLNRSGHAGAVQTSKRVRRCSTTSRSVKSLGESAFRWIVEK